MGRIIMSGIVAPKDKPFSGILVSTLAVGSSIYIPETEYTTARVEYIIVHQGNPDPTFYDDSCNGTWVLRKNIRSSTKWHDSSLNSYKDSAINSYLQDIIDSGTYSPEVLEAILEVKIPHTYSSVQSGANGHLTRLFLLAACEVGFSSSSSVPADGKTLSYFSGAASSKRIAYLNDSSTSATAWWLRSPYMGNYTNAYGVGTSGTSSRATVTTSRGVRPAFIINSNSKIDAETLELKGV